MSHAPIPDKDIDMMNALATFVDGALNGKEPKKWGFALLVYPFGQGPERTNINYIGTGDRDAMRVAFKEMVARWEGQLHTSETKQ